MAQAMDLWVESVERYNARHEDARRWEWVRFYDHMSRLHSQLAADYTARAEALLVRGQARAHESSTLGLPDSDPPEALGNGHDTRARRQKADR